MQTTIAYSRIATVANVPKGKTKQALAKGKPVTAPKDNTIKMQQLARERIVAVSENTDVLLSFAGTDTVSLAVAICDADEEIQQALQDEFGLSWRMIRKLYVEGVINPDLLNLKMESE